MTFIVSTKEMANCNPNYSRNYALYLAAGYQNDEQALLHALKERKLLETISFGKGYRTINEKLPYNEQYEIDFRPYASKIVDSFTASHKAAERGFKTALEILFQDIFKP